MKVHIHSESTRPISHGINIVKDRAPNFRVLILPNTITLGRSNFSLFAAAHHLIETNAAKQICALNPNTKDINEALIICNKILM